MVKLNNLTPPLKAVGLKQCQHLIFDTPHVAGAVLQTPLLLIHSLSCGCRHVFGTPSLSNRKS